MRHVFRCRHTELMNLAKQERRSIIDELNFCDFTLIMLDQDVLCLQVGMDNLSVTKEHQDFGDLYDDLLEQFSIVGELVVERLIVYLTCVIVNVPCKFFSRYVSRL